MKGALGNVYGWAVCCARANTVSVSEVLCCGGCCLAGAGCMSPDSGLGERVGGYKQYTLVAQNG
mgnify:CR=1 FL=1